MADACKLHVGRPVRVRPHPERGAHGHLRSEDGATGVVVAIGDSPELPDEPGRGQGRIRPRLCMAIAIAFVSILRCSK